MEERKTFSSYSFIFKIIAVILIMATIANFTLSAHAEETAQQYVREIILVTAPTLEKAVEEAKEASDATYDEKHPEKKRDYKVFETPIYVSEDTTTWLCYATTTNRNLAVTSIKTMNMRGEWSYEMYNEYLTTIEEKTKLLVKNMLVAVREYNKNLAANYPRAIYAKEIFDMLIEGNLDIEESNSSSTDSSNKKDSNLKVSEFFKEMGTEEFTNTEKEDKCAADMLRFLMESNMELLSAVESALLVACADTYAQNNDMLGDNLFDGLEEPMFLAGVNGYSTYNRYDAYADDIINSLPDLQKDLFYYINAKYHYTPEMEEFEKMIEDTIITKGEDEGKSDEKIAETLKDDVTKMLTAIANEEEIEDMEFTEKQAYMAWDLLDYYEWYPTLSQEAQQSYTSGRLLHTAFDGCYYKGYLDSNLRPQCNNMLGLMTKYNLNAPDVEQVNYKRSDFYPIIHLMSPGQRALLKLGFAELVSSVVNGVETLKVNKKAMLETVNSQLEDGETPITEKSTVSIYFGVDRSLFEKNSGIAMTSKAIEVSKNIPLSPDQAYYKNMERTATYVMIAAGATSAALTAATLGCAIKMQAYFTSLTTEAAGRLPSILGVTLNYLTIASKAASEQSLTATIGGATKTLVSLGEQTGKKLAFRFGNYLKAFISAGGIGTIMTVANVISIAVMLICMLVKFVAADKAAKADTPYIDIPRVMCSYEPLFDENAEGGLSKEYDYIYYYGLKNTSLTETDAARAANVADTEGNKTNILRHRIGDVANWTLHGADRQWVALYAANSKKAGNPILAGKFMVTNNPSSIGNGYTSVKMFNEGGAYDLQDFYSTTLKDNTIEKRYLGYMSESSQSSSQGASVFSKVTPIGMLVIGTLLGGGLGTLITYFATKKRKKVKTAEG